MIFTKTISEAAGGTAASFSRHDMFFTLGLIYQFECYFPPGSSGLLHVSVWDGGYQVWPSEPGETFFGDNTLITFPDRYFIDSARKALIVQSWNEDDTYAHVFQLRIGQVSEEAFIASFLPSMSMDKITETIAELIAGQATAKAERQAALSQATQEL